jgi:hypothetical protein
MPYILSILQHTPWPVFALFTFLVVLGIQALRPRTVYAWRLLVVPAVFIIWGIISLLSRSLAMPMLAVDWLVAAAAGAAIAAYAARLKAVDIDRSTGCVQVPGSVFPLLRNLGIFAAKYGLAVAMALVPEQKAPLAFWDIGISGLSAGYFIGWLLRFALKYRETPMSRKPEIQAVHYARTGFPLSQE